MSMNTCWTEPTTPAQKVAIEMLQHEQRMLMALGMLINPGQVSDMDSRRIRKTLKLARDLQQVRCAALRAIIIEEEQAKTR
jgi:hypothetical protein